MPKHISHNSKICLSAHNSLAGRKEAALLTISFRGDLQNGVSIEQKNFAELKENKLWASLTYCFSPAPVPRQSMAQQIEIREYFQVEISN